MGVIMKNGINYTGGIVGGSTPGGLPGVGYTGSDLILRDANGDISSVWYIDSNGDWVEYTKGNSDVESKIELMHIIPINSDGYSYIIVESEVT